MESVVQSANDVEFDETQAAVNVDSMDQELRRLEAMLFAATEPVAEANLANRLPEGCDVPALLAQLSGHYEGHGINLASVAGRWAFRTAPDLADTLEIEINVSRKLSRAAVETLAIIAYHQPVTRGDIEEIRGVALSKGTLDVLLEIGWIRPVGRRRTPGRPVTWGTASDFLDHFNLNELGDLPGVDEMKAAGLMDTRPVRTIFGEENLTDTEKNDEEEDDGSEQIEALDPNDGEAADTGNSEEESDAVPESEIIALKGSSPVRTDAADDANQTLMAG
jgi:segregation and condensation protein B